jgi:transposase
MSGNKRKGSAHATRPRHGSVDGRIKVRRAQARRRERIARTVRNGLTAREAAALFGVNPLRIRQICHAQGVRLGPGGDAGALARRVRMHEAIVRAGAAGADVDQLATRFGLTRRTVRVICNRRGVHLRPRPTPRRSRLLAARAAARSRGEELADKFMRGRPRTIARLLLTTTQSLDEIGRKCETSRQNVHYVWRVLSSWVSGRSEPVLTVGRTRLAPGPARRNKSP